MYSMVPQKVCVTSSGLRMDSLQRPKSVNTTWPGMRPKDGVQQEGEGFDNRREKEKRAKNQVAKVSEYQSRLT